MSSADSGGIWSVLSPLANPLGVLDAVHGIFYTADLPAGIFTFRYKVTGDFPCPDDSAKVSVILNPPPKADAGPDAILDCITPAALIGGVGTSSGGGETYAWQMAGNWINGADSGTWLADTPGVYVLQVTDALGCTASDEVLVSQTSEPLKIGDVKIVPVRCFGAKDGAIWVGSVTGGTQPVLLALNGGALADRRSFPNLSPGAYVLTAQDITGCEWQSDTLTLPEPPEIKIDLGADLEAALGDSVYLYLESSISGNGLDTVIWEPLLDSAASGSLYQQFLPLRSGKIRVLVADTNGCVKTDEIRLTVNRERRVYLPNAFFPEKEQNNVFVLYGGSDVAEVEAFKIFDRWGTCVFEATHFLPNDPSSGWDGTQGNRALPEGVYAFFAAIRFLDGEREIISGDVTLLR